MIFLFQYQSSWHFNFNCVLKGSFLTKTLLPLCVFSSTVDIITIVKRRDLFSQSLKTSSKGGATSKPWELYTCRDITELFSEEEGWVMDLCRRDVPIALENSTKLLKKWLKKSTQIVLEFLKKELNPRARQTREREGVHARHARPHDNPDERLLAV